MRPTGWRQVQFDGQILRDLPVSAGTLSAVLLDTLDDMEAARALYEELGFQEIPPYYHNPIPGAHYLKADLWVSGPAPLSSRL